MVDFGSRACSSEQASASSSPASGHSLLPSSNSHFGFVTELASSSSMSSPLVLSSATAEQRVLKTRSAPQPRKPRPLPNVPRHYASMTSLRPSLSAPHSHSASTHSLPVSMNSPSELPRPQLTSLAIPSAPVPTGASLARAPTRRPLPPTPPEKQQVTPSCIPPLERRPQLVSDGDCDKTSTSSLPRSSAPVLSIDTSSSCLRPPRQRRGRSATSPIPISPYARPAPAGASPLEREVSLQDLHRTNLAKLRRYLGTSVPPNLVIDQVPGYDIAEGHDTSEDDDEDDSDKNDDILLSAIGFAPPTPIAVERRELEYSRARDRPTDPAELVSAELPQREDVAVSLCTKSSDNKAIKGAATRRTSRLWFREKRGRRWVDDDYQGIVMELRMLR